MTSYSPDIVRPEISIGRGWRYNTLRLVLCAICMTAFAAPAYCQSTFGTVLGTVKDGSGAVVPKAATELTNTGTGTIHSALTDSNGNYEFVNIDVGSYKVTIAAVGFQKSTFDAFELSARETKRLDVALQVASQAVTVNVEGGSVVQTDVSNVAETKGSTELIDLPVALTTRANGSTSAFSTLTAQPGVQADTNGNISVAGTTPGQISVSIDGISSVGPGTIGALAELFPSFNAIEEIRISETLNPAEYGGVADVTTISKSGTNSFHGGAFENLQNNDFDAADFFSNTTPVIKMNDFGAFLGGPVVIPKLYNGHNKTFFFASVEFLRLPKQTTQVLSVPTAAMRSGDLSAYLSPANGGAANLITGYANNKIPQSQLNPFTQAVLNRFYPLPNYGAAGAIANNYLATFDDPINSAQGDVRIDQVINSKQLIYARYTYKNRRVSGPPLDSNSNVSSPLVGIYDDPEIDSALAVAYNWMISPTLVNEARGGFSRSHNNPSLPVNTADIVNQLGLQGLPSIPSFQDIPEVNLLGFANLYGQVNDTNPRQATTQFLDNLTWTKGKHTMKFGGDFRYLSSLFTDVFNNYRLGDYTFDGSTGILGSGAAAPMAQFLLGYPDLTSIATVLNPTTDSYAKHYAFFAQDDFKVSQSLTLNYGLRWEYHPMFRDHNNNLANFYPNYTSTVNGQTVNGAVIIPGQSTEALVNPGFAETVAPTPILLASQVGVPSSLRFSQKTDFAPRIGFAYRIGGSNKTVIRGGYGRFIESLLTSQVVDGWSVEASDVGYFSNSLGSNGAPIYKAPYSFPSNIAQPGTYFFDLASNVHYKDPKIDEWDLTFEHDLGKGIDFRASYDGNHSSSLGTLINLNQLHTNTIGYNTLSGDVPYPALSYIAYQTNLGFQNYDTGTFSVQKKTANFQFEGSYVYTRNLSNIYGALGGSTANLQSANEFGGTLSDPYNPGIDYGNVPFSRRNRVLVTYLYELPFGKGKQFLSGTNSVVSQVVSGWTLSGIALWQTGPFMTVSTTNDPSGTGYNQLNSNGGRADTVPGQNPYAGQSLNQWINPNAFVDPPNNIGRFGDSQQGSVVGPGTTAVSFSLLKRIAISENARFEVGGQVANLFNHPNFAAPSNLTVGVAGFGQINALQSAEGAGPRAIQLTGRITF
jgi:hypothetical protein